MREGRIPSLDGWRGLFCVAVLWSHFIQPGDLCGLLAVRCFFVLSSFLITDMLLAEARGASTVDIGNFVVRRCARLLPVYFAFMVVMAVSQAAGAVHFTAVEWIGTLTFTQNFLGDAGDDWPIFHLWSLSIEQQFYVLWPAGFLMLVPWLGLRRVLVWGGVLVTFSVFFRAAAVVVQKWDGAESAAMKGFFSQISTFNYLDSLAIGALAACIVFHFRPRLVELPLRLVAMLVVVGAAMMVLPTVARQLHMPSIALHLTGATIASMGCALLLVVSVLWPRLWPFSLLNTRPAVFMGTVSYSVYIWQQPFTETWLQDYSTATRLAVAVGTGVLSYYVLERPLVRLRTRLRAGRRTVPPALVSRPVATAVAVMPRGDVM